jgi:hypothetical protein
LSINGRGFTISWGQVSEILTCFMAFLAFFVLENVKKMGYFGLKLGVLEQKWIFLVFLLIFLHFYSFFPVFTHFFTHFSPVFTQFYPIFTLFSGFFGIFHPFFAHFRPFSLIKKRSFPGVRN